jgi:hypothetical protein
LSLFKEEGLGSLKESILIEVSQQNTIAATLKFGVAAIAIEVFLP